MEVGGGEGPLGTKLYSYVEALLSSVTVFRGKAFKEVVRLNKVTGVGPNPK